MNAIFCLPLSGRSSLFERLEKLFEIPPSHASSSMSSTNYSNLINSSDQAGAREDALWLI
jgi:hypothetical protein